MRSSNDEVKSNLLNSMKAVIFEGSLRDWISVMTVFAIPVVFAFNLMAVINSFVNNLLVPFTLTPLVAVLHMQSLGSWRIGSIGIGILMEDLISVSLNFIILFILTRDRKSVV